MAEINKQPEREVFGRVLFTNGKPVVGAEIRVLNKRLKKEEEIERGKTDKQGNFRITYSGMPDAGVNLRVEVWDTAGKKLTETTPIRYNAAAKEFFAITVDNLPSEYENLLEKLRPALSDATLKDVVSSEEIDFLVNATRQDKGKVARIVKANQQKDKGFHVETWYALFSQLPQFDPTKIYETDPTALERAVKTALSQNIVPKAMEPKLLADIRKVVDKKMKPFLSLRAGRKKASAGDLIKMSFPDKDKAHKAVAIFLNRPSFDEDHFTSLEKAGFTSEELKRLRNTLTLAGIVNHHLPLLKILTKDKKYIDEPNKLATLTSEDLKGLVLKSRIPMPSDIEGKDKQTKLDTYLKQIRNNIFQSFPTAVARHDINMGIGMLKIFKQEEQEDLEIFFYKNPDFDLAGKYNVDNLLSKMDNADKSILNKPALSQNLRTLKGMMNLGVKPEHIEAMHKAGFRNSLHIAKVTQGEFVERTKVTFGSVGLANRVYANALESYYAGLKIYTNIIGLRQGGKMTVYPPAREINNLPEWRSLFGSLDRCECEECQSVFGLAAYFVEIMRFLEKSNNGKSYEQLIKRRPDLEYIELTCKNANTELPYIDLVNEILENAVLRNVHDLVSFPVDLKSVPPSLEKHLKDAKGSPLTVDALGKRLVFEEKNANPYSEYTAWLQTTRDAEDLKVQPEHINTKAYDEIAGAFYPWSLPFHLWNSQTTRYLRQLNIERWEWMEMFTFGAVREAEVAVAAAYLGLSNSDRKILKENQGLWKYWGFNKATFSENTIPNPAKPREWLPSELWAVLLKNRVDVLLQQSGLSYIELLQLLSTRYINPVTQEPMVPTSQGKLQIEGPSDDPTICNLEKVGIPGLTEAHLSKMHRFVRLSRRLGWHFYDLDRAITALQGTSSPDKNQDDFFQDIFRIERIRTLLGNADLEIVLTFFSPGIDTTVYYDYESNVPKEIPSQYERLFRSRKVLANNAASLADFPFPKTAEAWSLSDLRDSKKEAVLLAVLGINASDFQLLIDSGRIPLDKPDRQQDPTLNLAQLFRHAKLAKLLGLSIQELLYAIQLGGPAGDPFPKTGKTKVDKTAPLLNFVQWVQRAKAHKVSIEELAYLLLHEYRPESSLQPRMEEITKVLTDLRTGLQKIQADNASTEDTTGDLLATKLALIGWEKPFVDEVLALLRGNRQFESKLDTLPTSVNLKDLKGNIRDRVDYDEVSKKLIFLGIMSNADKTKLMDFSSDTSFKKAVDDIWEQTRSEFYARLCSFRFKRYEVLLNKIKKDNGVDQAINGIPDIKLPIFDNNRHIEYNAQGKQLQLRMDSNDQIPLKEDELKELLSLSQDDRWQEAVMNLAMDITPTTSLGGKSYYSAPLDSLPKIEIPADINYRIFINSTNKGNIKLGIKGQMTPSEKERLLALSEDTAFNSSVEALLEKAKPEAVPDEDKFLSKDDINRLLNISNPANRIAYVLSKLQPHLIDYLSTELILNKCSESLGIGLAELTQLDQLWKKVPQGSSLVSVFKAPDFVTSSPNINIDPVVFTEQYNRYILLNKLALWVNRLGLKSPILNWLVGTQSYGWFDLADTPIKPNWPLKNQWQKIDFMLKLLEVADSLPQGSETLHEFFELAQKSPAVDAAYLKQVADLTKWDQHAFGYLTGANGMDLHTPSNIIHGAKLWQLYQCLDGLKQVGIKAEDGMLLAKTDLEASDAAIAIQAVRAKYDDKSWPDVAAQLNDTLREQQRDALTAYLIAHPEKTGGIKCRDSKDLFSYFLIDVDMGACMNTSRLRQAALTVQLFIQRCQMNLEDDLSLSECESMEWNQWMKYYRVWEANRRIFIYPENWIEPDLRDDKTPFFKELENDLLQNDLNKETAETAFVNYLEKLDQVAKLEIVAMCWEDQEVASLKNCFSDNKDNTDTSGRPSGQQESPIKKQPIPDKMPHVIELPNVPIEISEVKGQINPRMLAFAGDLKGIKQTVKVLHVFGRTPGIPHTYYHRQQMPEGTWTPWERIDLDIEGDHLIPVVWNHRLYLFWPMFMEKSDTTANKDAGTDSKVSYYYFEIKMARSEYRNGKWVAKKISKTPLITRPSIFASSYPLIETDKGNYANRKIQLNDFSFFVSNNTSELLEFQCFGPANLNGEKEIFVPSPKDKGQEQIINKIECFGFNPARCLIWVKNYADGLPGGTTGINVPIKDSKGQNYSAGEFEYDWESDGLNPLFTPPEVVQKILMYPRFTNAGFVFPRMAHNVENVNAFYIDSQDFLIKEIRINYKYEHNNVYYAKLEYDNQGNPKNSWDGSEMYHYWPTNYDYNEIMWMLMRGWHEPTKYNKDGVIDFDIIEVFVEKPNSPIVDEQPILIPKISSHQLLGKFNMQACNSEIASSNEYGSSITSPFNGTWIFNNLIEGYFPFKLPSGNDLVLNTQGKKYSLVTTTKADGYNGAFSNDLPIFFQNERQTYFLPRDGEERIQIHYHPYACNFIYAIKSEGVDGLLKREIQQKTDEGVVLKQYGVMTGPKEEVDFSKEGAYSIYNWEIFFHAPFEIAVQLSKNQKFEEAQKWFHYIFDPTSRERGENEKYWKFKPFYEEAKSAPLTLDALFKDAAELSKEVNAWKRNPFNPHALARVNYLAYMKTVVMHYLDNLFEWGDQLFSRDTRESIMEATQLYILAYQILGRKPERIPSRAEPKISIYHELKGEGSKLDAFDDFFQTIDSYYFPSAAPGGGTSARGLGQMLYFCIPQNDMLIGYWEKLEDRLYKIRHCMNIEGVVRDLPLLEPPIDPALLVRAAAAGLDLNSVLNDMNAPLPLYRFNFMVQKAMELANEVKSLGGVLLSALEKRDAEQIALLRSQHEIQILELTRDVRRNQLEETMRNKEGIEKSKESAIERKNYYSSIEFMSAWEIGAMALNAASLISHGTGAAMQFAASPSHQIPDQHTGSDGLAPTTNTKLPGGGEKTGKSIEAWATGLKDLGSIMNMGAGMSSTYAGYWRRWNDWKLQERLADIEIKQLDKQLAAADIRIAIAEKELNNHEQQMENARTVDEVMHSKFSNRELYNWMVGQISGIYFQAYKLAYDMAKRAERCYQHELGDFGSNVIQFGYWDSLNRGLLAAEKLAMDLKKLESSYYEKNKREYELTKHISVNLLDPSALTLLKKNGQCEIELPEWLFDLDYPGHYFRRVKSVSISIPCVAGPYTTINCTLRLLRSTVRMKSILRNGEYQRDEESGNDNRFRDDYTVQSIATSSAQNDSGLFELNFRDERYLPFEGSGAVSRWRIELNEENRQFDYNSIADILVHLKFTAREGGDGLKKEANQALKEIFESAEETPLLRAFSLRYDFPQEYNQLKNRSKSSVEMTVKPEMFPYMYMTRFKGLKSTFESAYKLLAKTGARLEAYKADDTPVVVNDSNIVTVSRQDDMNEIADIIWILRYSITS